MRVPEFELTASPIPGPETKSAHIKKKAMGKGKASSAGIGTVFSCLLSPKPFYNSGKDHQFRDDDTDERRKHFARNYLSSQPLSPSPLRKFDALPSITWNRKMDHGPDTQKDRR